MLKREDAHKSLTQEQIKDWEKQAVADIAGQLSEDLRPTAYALLDRDADGTPLPHQTHQDQERSRRIHLEAAHTLFALDTTRRLTLFQALLPGVASHLEAAWSLLGRLPYQTGSWHRAFRLREVRPSTAEAPMAWFAQLLRGLGQYRQKDVTWFAAWAAYLDSWYLAQPLTVLFAAAIDAGGAEGDAVFDILCTSARCEHPIGAMGRHVAGSLLITSRPEGWAFIERLLLAAQREEGLRQVILETVDDAHPDAFRRMLRLILDHDLIRFSAVIRAANVWLGFSLTVDDARLVRDIMAELLDLLNNREARQQALAPRSVEEVESAAGPKSAAAGRATRARAREEEALHAARAAQHIYLALWAVAFEDTEGAIVAAGPVLRDPDPLRRLAAAHLLGQIGLPDAGAALVPSLDDPDLRVALSAFSTIQGFVAADDRSLFEHCQALLPRLNKKTPSLESGLWPWLTLDAQPERVADALVRHLGSRPPTALLPYISQMSGYTRLQAARLLAALPAWDAPILDTFFSLAADRSSYVRDEALKIIGTRSLTPEIAMPLEGLLSRKSSETRRSLLTMLLKQSDNAALASSERLLTARNPLQRLAGLDLLHEMSRARRAAPQCRDAARAYQSAHAALTNDEQVLITAILSTEQPEQMTPTLRNVLGLIDPTARTQPVAPRPLPVLIDTPAALACLRTLDDLIEQHTSTPVVLKGWAGSDEHLFGNLSWFPGPDLKLTPQEDAANLPLAEIWQEWQRTRPAGTRDADGLELLRAQLLLTNSRVVGGTGVDLRPQFAAYGLAGLVPVRDEEEASPGTTKAQVFRLRHRDTIMSLLNWLLRLQEPYPAATTGLLLDVLEASLALIPRAALEEYAAKLAKGESARDPRSDSSLHLVQAHRAAHPATWTRHDHLRLWSLLHWLDRPAPGIPRLLPDLELVLMAHQADAANEADILDHLAVSVRGRRHYGAAQAQDLSALTARKPHPLLESYPALQRLVPALRDRILEVELARGELPTPATALARALQYAGGKAIFVRLLAALASGDLARGYQYDGESRVGVFSYLLRTTHPAPHDTYEAFAALIASARIEPKRLVAAAVYVPQWARHVEHALGWSQLEDAIWWIHAHTKDEYWTVDHALRESWNAQVSERTPLNGQDLVDGAVDVAWFWRSYQGLGAERWEDVYAAAKYASNGAGHARARLFADAMLGRTTDAELLQRVTATRRQDAVRALGLLPLPSEPVTAHDAMVTARYQIIQDFLRTTKQFGAGRRASEALAARIGLENLARTAGYADPIRLQWAMEAQLGADLREGSLSVEVEGVCVTLSLNPLTAQPAITITRNGKPLKVVPTKIKKSELIVALQERKREIERQVSRMRISLEAAMCRGDRFTAAEIAGLLDHPVLARLLRNLIFVQDDPVGTGLVSVLGYPMLLPEVQNPTEDQTPTDSFHMLRFQDHAGDLHTVETVAPVLRLAHPYDLFSAGNWHGWQHDCFARERIQPFKQVFRELHVLTQNELRQGDEASSSRYTGQQVQPRQAMALFGQRGWITGGDEGVRRTFHQEGFSAHVNFDGGYFTPAEVEGLTIDRLFFTTRDSWKLVPLKDVPPRIFSEVMRDLDLVVSVAHRGGVDPEATASTVEMRAALVRETCALLHISNVSIKSAHTLIEGTLGNYSVHLGSAVVHRQPGGALCIVPVHSQHRGRLFLPFADDDPRTAEVVSKVVLLARDSEIKDPSILEQIL